MQAFVVLSKDEPRLPVAHCLQPSGGQRTGGDDVSGASDARIRAAPSFRWKAAGVPARWSARGERAGPVRTRWRAASSLRGFGVGALGRPLAFICAHRGRAVHPEGDRLRQRPCGEGRVAEGAGLGVAAARDRAVQPRRPPHCRGRRRHDPVRRGDRRPWGSRGMERWTRTNSNSRDRTPALTPIRASRRRGSQTTLRSPTGPPTRSLARAMPRRTRQRIDGW